jgi:hypothetical protein
MNFEVMDSLGKVSKVAVWNAGKTRPVPEEKVPMLYKS